MTGRIGNWGREPAGRPIDRGESPRSGARPERSGARSFPFPHAGLAQGPPQVADQRGKRATARAAPSDQDKIDATQGLLPLHGAHGLAQASARTIAHDSVPDLFCHGKADPGGIGILPAQSLKHKSGRGYLPPPGGNPQEFRPFLETDGPVGHCQQPPATSMSRIVIREHDRPDNQADRRLRPLARRLAITLRPPTVSIRARKP